MISTDLQDIMFGTPVPVLGTINLGVFKEDQVNVIVHGHEPLLPELLVVASRDPEIKKLAVKVGAKGINLAGMCCSANEVLMRHGIPCAGNFLQQELGPRYRCGGTDDCRCAVRDAGPSGGGGVFPHETHHDVRQGKDRGGHAYRVSSRDRASIRQRRY